MKNFGDLPRDTRIHLASESARLVHSNGLDRFCKVKVLQQRVFELKTGGVEKRDVLLVEGKASLNEAEQIANFKQEMKAVSKGVNPRTLAVQIKSGLKVGAAMIPLVGVANHDTYEEITIEHDGSVMLLDFWATWCPPCQAPMKHNHEMIDKHSDWRGKVRIIGISIDQEPGKVKPHVQKHGYQNVEHFLRASSTCDEDYGVQGVPHVVLVDKQGIIQYIGHPMGTNLEEDIQTLVNGGSLAKGGEEESKEEEEEQGDHVPMRPEEADRETQKLESALKANLRQLSEGAKDLLQGVVAVISEELRSHDSVKYELVVVLAFAGSKDKLAALKKKVTDIVESLGTNYKVVDRCRAM